MSMKARAYKTNNIDIVVLEDDSIVLKNAQDLLDILGAYQVRNIILKKEMIIPAFFDLKTKVAGEILQKASNYGVKIGIVGDFKNINSKSLRDFIYESNATKQIVFKETVEEIVAMFGRSVDAF